MARVVGALVLCAERARRQDRSAWICDNATRCSAERQACEGIWLDDHNGESSAVVGNEALLHAQMVGVAVAFLLPFGFLVLSRCYLRCNQGEGGCCARRPSSVSPVAVAGTAPRRSPGPAAGAIAEGRLERGDIHEHQ